MSPKTRTTKDTKHTKVAGNGDTPGLRVGRLRFPPVVLPPPARFRRRRSAPYGHPAPWSRHIPHAFSPTFCRRRRQNIGASISPGETIYGAGCKLQQSSRHAPSCRPPRCAQPQPRRVVCTQKGKSPLSVPAATSCRWTERQRKAANTPSSRIPDLPTPICDLRFPVSSCSKS